MQRLSPCSHRPPGRPIPPLPQQAEGQRLPNLTHPDVPLGGEDNAATLRTVGAQREFEFEPRDHVTVMEALDLIDFESAAEVSGSKFYYLKNAAALLELALVNYAMTKARGWPGARGVACRGCSGASPGRWVAAAEPRAAAAGAGPPRHDQRARLVGGLVGHSRGG